MEKILGTLITIILIFYGLRLIGRLLMVVFMKRLTKHITKNFGDEGFGTANEEETMREREGDITITKKQKNGNEQSLSDELGGEYVDFEEVK